MPRLESVETQRAIDGIDEPDFADPSALVGGKFSNPVVSGGAW